MNNPLSIETDFERRLHEAQKFTDSECIRCSAKFTPRITGQLIRSATLGTVIGSGKIVYNAPYARYQYYGIVYGPNFPVIEDGKIVGWKSPKKKYPTNRKLQYSTAANRLAGSFWFEKMKSAHKQEILRGAAAIIGGKK